MEQQAYTEISNLLATVKASDSTEEQIEEAYFNTAQKLISFENEDINVAAGSVLRKQSTADDRDLFHTVFDQLAKDISHKRNTEAEMESARKRDAETREQQRRYEEQLRQQDETPQGRPNVHPPRPTTAAERDGSLPIEKGTNEQQVFTKTRDAVQAHINEDKSIEAYTKDFMEQYHRPPSIAELNKHKYGNVFKTTNIPVYTTFSLGMQEAIYKMSKASPQKKTPQTYEELLNFNNDIIGCDWILRGVRRPNADDGERYDAGIGTTTSSNPWMNMCYYPVVASGVDQNFYGYFVPVVYSSFPLTPSQLRHQPNYRQMPLSPTSTINVDSTMLADTNAIQAVMAAMLNTYPTNGSYISFCIAVPFSGASCGLATALAIMGAPPVAATGFIHSTHPNKEDDIVEQIDNMDIKAVLAIREQYPLLCPSKDVLGNKNRVYDKYAQNVYTSGMYNSARQEWTYLPTNHFLILVTSLTEALTMATHVWTRKFESRPDIAIIRNKMATEAANWEDQRRQLMNTGGGVNTQNLMAVLGKPFLNAPNVKTDTKFKASGKFALDPTPNTFQDEEENVPSNPIARMVTRSQAKKQQPKKRGR